MVHKLAEINEIEVRKRRNIGKLMIDEIKCHSMQLGRSGRARTSIKKTELHFSAEQGQEKLTLGNIPPLHACVEGYHLVQSIFLPPNSGSLWYNKATGS